MVRIVGKDLSYAKQITCKSCGCILEYNLGEVKSHHGRDYSGGPDGCEWVDCPNCRQQVIIRSW